MKKTLCILMAIAALFSFCMAESGLANPMTQYDSLEAVNEEVGCALCHPAVMGVVDNGYFVIDNGEYLLADYQFTVNGYVCDFRCAATTEDISGVYIAGAPAFSMEFEGEIQFTQGDGMHLARWFDVNGQYCFLMEDPDSVMDDETFHLIAAEMKDLTSPVPTAAEITAYFEALEGEYGDVYSERAYAVIAAEDDHAYMTIFWASSAEEYTRWDLTLTLGEEGLLFYNDCACTDVTNAGEEEIVVVRYENGEGFFAEVDGTLYWVGASEAECTECTFVKDAD